MPEKSVTPLQFITRYDGNDYQLLGTFVILFETDPIKNSDQIPRYLSALSYSITMPNIQIDFLNFDTKVKNKILIPNSITVNQNFSIRFYDIKEQLILKYFQNWILATRKHFQNIVLTDENIANIKNPSSKINIAVAITDETFEKVYKTIIFAGCYPTSIPISVLNLDIGNKQVVSIDMQFNFDFLILANENPMVNNYLNSIRDDLKTIHNQILTKG